MTRHGVPYVRREGSVLTRCGVALAIGASALLVMAQPALAHAEYSDSEPAKNVAVDQPPDEISISFTEPPAGNAGADVIDGCGRDVAGETRARGEKLIIAVEGGEPGDWMVGYSVISLVDGHPTKGDFSFTVTGKADCEAVATGAEPGPEGRSSMTSAQLVLVAVTSALVAVFTTLLVATVRRARVRDDVD